MNAPTDTDFLLVDNVNQVIRFTFPSIGAIVYVQGSAVPLEDCKNINGRFIYSMETRVTEIRKASK